MGVSRRAGPADILEELGRAADALESQHYPHTTAAIRAAAREIAGLRAERDRLRRELAETRGDDGEGGDE
jgi:hypothetical protein